MLPLNQHHACDPSTIFKPMNQRPLFRFLVKFITKCHSLSVSIETSELFSWLPHLSLALSQSIISSWKEYLEQTVTNWKPRKKTNKENNRFTYLLVVYIIQELEKATQKKNWNKPSNTHESFYICHDAVGIGWTKLWISRIRSLHNSKNTWEAGIHFPSL